MTALLAHYPRYAAYRRTHPAEPFVDQKDNAGDEKMPVEVLLKESALQEMVRFAREDKAKLEETLRQLDYLQQRQIIDPDKVLLVLEVYQLAMRLMQEVLDQFNAGKYQPEEGTEWRALVNVEKVLMLIDASQLTVQLITDLRREATEVRSQIEFIARNKGLRESRR